MGSIVEAMELSLKNIGVNIITGNGAKEILIKNSKVKGIVLSDGKKINTRLILSAINPKITLDPNVIPREIHYISYYKSSKLLIFLMKTNGFQIPPDPSKSLRRDREGLSAFCL